MATQQSSSAPDKRQPHVLASAWVKFGETEGYVYIILEGPDFENSPIYHKVHDLNDYNVLMIIIH